MTRPARTLVIVPTFDEREALPVAIAAILAEAPEVDILVVDDGSPDGTGEIADAIAAGDERVRVLHRTTDRGLGRAYLAGFRHAMAARYELVAEMDADGSHPAEALRRMVAALDESGDEVVGVIGSRWVEGGAVVDWPKRRELISRMGSAYSRFALGIPVRDVTAGLRLYRVSALRALDLDDIASRGYCFQVDMTRRLIAAGGRLIEVPIVFRERELGSSKMHAGIVVEAMLRVTGWGLQRVFGRRAPQVE